jgi:hypothetical protein
MSIPRRGVKIMSNNIREKSGMAAPHSKPKTQNLKASGQELNPNPEIMKKKIKKKKRKDPINSEIEDILSHKREIRGLA